MASSLPNLATKHATNDFRKSRDQEMFLIEIFTWPHEYVVSSINEPITGHD